jgi:hypothetical protein
MTKRRLDISGPTLPANAAGGTSTPKKRAPRKANAANANANATANATANTAANNSAEAGMLELEDFVANPDASPDQSPETVQSSRPRRHWILGSLGLICALGILYAISFEIAHVGKIYPGVVADGVPLSGLSQDAAARVLTQRFKNYTGQIITITQGNTNLRIPIANLQPTYSAARAAEAAYAYGRRGTARDKPMPGRSAGAPRWCPRSNSILPG